MKKAGRPKGTTKENNKKMYSFRLSEEELKAVKEVLAKMRGKLILLFCLLTFMLPCCAVTLEAGIEYTEDTARTAAFEGVSKYLTFANTRIFDRSLFITGINYNDVSQVLEYKVKCRGIPFKYTGVIYKDEPNRIYAYTKESNGYKGRVVVVYKVQEDAVKTANYDAQSGRLICVGFVTHDEEYKYDVNGKLLGYWKGNKLKSADKHISAVLSVLYNSP